MTPLPDDSTEIRSDLLRLEGKIDVVLGRHEERLETLRRDLDRLREDFAKRGSAASAWVAVTVAGLAVVIDPILNALISSKP